MTRVRTERGLDRLVNFSDATVAIAITLLVLPLIDLSSEVKDHSVGYLFSHHVGAFIAFGVSFAVIGRLWMVHHRVFECVSSYTYQIAWLNMLWLASIAFLPFAANVLSNLDSGNAAADVLYTSTILVSTLAMLAIEVLVIRNPELLREDARDQLDPVDAALMAAILVVALVLAVAVPGVGMLWLALLVTGPRLRGAVSWIVRRRRQRTATEG